MSEGLGSRVEGLGYGKPIAWQKAHELALAIYQATKPISRSDSWLRTQANRSAVSVPANIAEGYSRGSGKECIQFLNIARGSLAETEYYIIFMRDAGLLSTNDGQRLADLSAETARVLLGPIRSLRAQPRVGTSEPSRIGEEAGEYGLLDPRPYALDPTSEAQ